MAYLKFFDANAQSDQTRIRAGIRLHAVFHQRFYATETRGRLCQANFRNGRVGPSAGYSQRNTAGHGGGGAHTLVWQANEKEGLRQNNV